MAMHTKDSDCTVGADDLCAGCGTHHGDSCTSCRGRGFHAMTCARFCEVCETMADGGDFHVRCDKCKALLCGDCHGASEHPCNSVTLTVGRRLKGFES